MRSVVVAVLGLAAAARAALQAPAVVSTRSTADNTVTLNFNKPGGDEPSKYRVMAIGHDVIHNFDGTEDPGVDLDLWTKAATVSCPLGPANLDTTSRPGWLRATSPGSCNQYSDRGNAAMLLRDTTESQYIETAIDWATAFRAGVGNGGTVPTPPGPNGLDFGLVVYDKVVGVHVLQLTVRVQNNELRVLLQRRGARIATSPVLASYGATNRNVVWIRLERTSRASRRFIAKYKVSESAAWTTLSSATEGTVGRSYPPWSTEVNNLQYGVLFKAFTATPSNIGGGAQFVADFDYLRAGQWFDDPACPDRPMYYTIDAPSGTGVISVPMTGLRHGMYKYVARVQAISGDGSTGNPLVYGPWSAPTGRFIPVPRPPPLMEAQGGNTNQLAYVHNRFYQETIDYKPRASGTLRVTHMPSQRLGATTGHTNFRNEVGGTGSPPIVASRVNYDQSGFYFGWNNDAASELRRSNANSGDLEPRGDEMTYVIVFRHRIPFSGTARFPFAGGSRVGNGNGFSATLWKDGSVGFRAVTGSNRGATRITGRGHSQPQMMIAFVTWAGSTTRCLSVRVAGSGNGFINNGFSTVPENQRDNCVGNNIQDNNDGFMVGAHLNSAGQRSQGLNGEIYALTVMREELNEFTMPGGQRATEALEDYMGRRYYLKCSPSESPNVGARTGATRGFPAAEACRRDQWNNGWCQETCASGTVLQMGGTRRDCDWGSWGTAHPVCARMCPEDEDQAVIVGGGNVCTRRLFSLNFDTADIRMAGEQIWGTRVRPLVPDYAMAKHFDLSSGVSMRVKSLPPSCTEAPVRLTYTMSHANWQNSAGVREHTTTATVTLRESENLRMPRSQAGVAARFSSNNQFYGLEISAPPAGANASTTRTVRIIKLRGGTETVLASAVASDVPIAYDTAYVLRLTAMRNNILRGVVHLGSTAATPIPSAARGAWWQRSPELQASTDDEARFGRVLFDVEVTDTSAPNSNGNGGVTFIGEAEFDDLSVESPCDPLKGGSTCDNMGPFGQCIRQCGPGYFYSGGSPVKQCSLAGAYSFLPRMLAGGATQALSALTCGLKPPVFRPGSSVRSVLEDSPVNAAVGTPLDAFVESPEISVEYTLTDDAEGMFKIGRCSGQIIVARANLDFETRQSYNVTVSAVSEDPSGVKSTSVSVNITVLVEDRNEPPFWLPDGDASTVSVYLPENATVGMVVPGAQLLAADPDGPDEPIAYELLVAGPTRTSFVIDNVTGVISVGPDGPNNLDYEGGEPVLVLLVAIFDPRFSTDAGLRSSRFVEVNVLNSPDPPRFTEPTAPAERYIAFTSGRIGGVAGTPLFAEDQDAEVFSEPDPDQQNGTVSADLVLTYSLVSGGMGVDPTAPPGSPAMSVFTVDADSGELIMAADITNWYGIASEDKGVSPSGRPYLDAFSGRVRVTDVSGLFDELDVVVYVISNSSIRGLPILQAVELEAAGPFSDPAALEFISPRGGDIIRIRGENFASPNSREPIFLNLTMQGSVAGVHFQTTDCRHVSPQELNCTTPPGIGSVTVSVAIADRVATPSVTATLTLKYAPPSVAVAVYDDYDPFAGGASDVPTDNTASGADGNFATRGGDTFTLLGTNLGPDHPLASRYLSVRYGPPSDPTRYAAAVSRVRLAPESATDPIFTGAVTATTSAGVGAGLVFTVEVAGDEDGAALTATSLSYERPSLVSVAGGDAAGQVDVDALRTAGGQLVRLSGTGFGPARTDGTSHVTAYYGKALFGASLGRDDPVPEGFVAVDCRPDGDSHTTVLCRTAPGTGADLGWIVDVEMQLASIAVPATDVDASYGPPVILEAFGPGATDADTRGGDVVSLRGSNFPPVFTLPSLLSARYGPARELGRHAAQSCMPVSLGLDSVGVVSCVLSEGTGRDHQWSLTVDGLASAFTTDANTSYAPPTLSAFSGANIDAADTAGTTLVTISGTNFGPNSTMPSGLLRLVSATYQTRLAQTQTASQRGSPPRSLGANGTLLFGAADCVMTRAHTQLQCRKTEGAGEGFAWTVTVDGQASGAPRTSYAAPRVDSVLAADGVSPAGPADTAGGTVYTLVGANFGPAGSSPLYGSLVQSVRFGASGTERAVRGWLVTSHTTMQVTLPSGLGSELRFTVVVADQPSASSPTFSYSPPVVLSVAPPVISASASAASRRITIRGTSLGVVAASGGAIYAAVGNPQTETDAGVGDTVALIPARSARVLPAAEATVAGEQEIVVDVPAGAGAVQAVRVVAVPASETEDDDEASAASQLATVADARRRGASVSSRPTGTTGTGFVAGVNAINFTSPVVSSVIVARPSTPEELDASRGMLGAGADLSAVRVVYMVGDGLGTAPPSLFSTFGNGSTGLEEPDVRRSSRLRIGRAPLQQTFPVPVSGFGAGSTVMRILSWTDQEVKVIVVVSEGEVSLRVENRDFDWNVVARSTPFETFLGLSPTISALLGAETPFPTRGGTAANPLVIQAANLANSQQLMVKVGGRDCALINEAGDRYDLIADTVILDVQRQFDAARALNTPVEDIVYTLRCIVPPGQGSRVPVVIERDTNSSAPSTAHIAYAAPVISAISAHDMPAAGLGLAPLPTARSQWPTVPILEVPTFGGVLRIEGANLGPCPTIVMGDVATIEACAPGTDTPRAGINMDTTSHTWIEVPAAAGEGRGTNFLDVGALGFQVRHFAGDQQASPASVAMRYASPTITGISGTPSPSTGGPIILTGRDFGEPTRGALDGLAPVVELLLPAASRAGVGSAAAMTIQCDAPSRDAMHTSLNCTVPPGTGHNLAVRVKISDLDPVAAGVTFSYARPEITAWSTATASGAAGAGAIVTGVSTDGTTSLTLTGRNFGAFNALTSCVFVTWAAAPRDEASRTSGVPQSWWVGTQFDGASAPPAPLSCSGQAEWRGEGELMASESLVWQDGMIQVLVPPGVGTRSVWVLAGGNAAVAPVRMAYAAPSLAGASLMPARVATDGSEPTVLSGAGNLGPAVRDTSANPVADADYPLTIAEERMLPTAAVVVNISSVCAADASALGPSGQIVAPLRGCGAPGSALTSSGRVTGRTHTGLTLVPPIGVGTMHRLGVMVVEAGSVVAASDPSSPVFLNYRVPAVVSTDPTRLEVDADVVPAGVAAALSDASGLLASRGGTVGTTSVPAALSCGPGSVEGVTASQAMQLGSSHPGFEETLPTKRLLIEVQNVGTPPTDLCDARFLPWSPLARVLNVTVGDRACARAYRVNARGRLFVQCDVPNSPVGFHDVAVFAAGQLGTLPATDPRAMQVVCDSGFFGRPGEMCLACPQGANCAGFDPDAVDFSLEAQLAVVELSRQGAGGAQAVAQNASFASVLAPYEYPRPEPGFFNLNTTSMLEACPFSNRISGRDVCITACEPKFACTGDNFCATGYTSTAPEYRCNSCAQGYYRRAGLCEECPDNPYLVVATLLIIAMAAAVGAWWLNRVGAAISFIQIGVDYMQVLAIFASARFALPDALRDLFSILSALNLNIDIVAPECFIPDVDALEKWFVFQAIPIAVVFVLTLGFVGSFLFNMFCKARKYKEAIAQAGFDRSVNLLIVFMYVLYLQASKTSLDALACVPTDPVQTDENGEVITYLQMVFEPCSKPGGVHQTLLPFAIITIAVYSIGYPLFCAYVIWRHWRGIYLDQLLRAVGTGETESTNSNLWLRQRYGRVYNFFKPTRAWWILVLLGRKFLIALITLWFSVNPAYQLAMTLLVLFIAFALQVRLVPFMSSPERAQVLVEHRSRAMTSPKSLDAQLKVVIDSVADKGRRRSTFSRGLDASSARTLATSLGSMVVGSILISANGVELTMLFSAVLVTVCGLLFESGRLDSEFYADQRDTLTYFVIVLVILSLVYFVVVLLVELQALCTNSKTASKGKKGKAGKAGDAGGRSRAAGFISAMAGAGAGGGTDAAVLEAATKKDDDDAVAFEQQANPLFAAARDGTSTVVSEGDPVADAFIGMNSPPDASEWAVFKATMQRMQMRIADLQRENGVMSRKTDVSGMAGARATTGAAAARRATTSTGTTRKQFGQSIVTGTGAAVGADAVKPSVAGKGLGGLRMGRRASGRKLSTGSRGGGMPVKSAPAAAATGADSGDVAVVTANPMGVGTGGDAAAST